MLGGVQVHHGEIAAVGAGEVGVLQHASDDEIPALASRPNRQVRAFGESAPLGKLARHERAVRLRQQDQGVLEASRASAGVRDGVVAKAIVLEQVHSQDGQRGLARLPGRHSPQDRRGGLARAAQSTDALEKSLRDAACP